VKEPLFPRQSTTLGAAADVAETRTYSKSCPGWSFLHVILGPDSPKPIISLGRVNQPQHLASDKSSLKPAYAEG
jgi:hypothetical protein